MKLSLTRKLKLVTVAIIVALVACSICANLYMWSLHKSVSGIVEKCVSLVAAAQEMDTSNSAKQIQIKNYLLESDSARLCAIEEKIRDLTSKHDLWEMEVDKAIKSSCHEPAGAEMHRIWAKATTTIIPAFDREMADTLVAHRDYLELRAKMKGPGEGETGPLDLYEKEQARRAKRLDHMANLDTLGRQNSKMDRELIALAQEDLGDMLRRTDHLMQWTRVAFVVVSIGVFLGCWVVIHILSKRIVKSILTLSDAARAMTKGDLTRRVEVSTNDEIGELCAAFNGMVEDLRSTTTPTKNLDREITERRKAEDALDKLNGDLESVNLKLTRTNKELREFAHIAAHDLKTPLRAIGTLAEWISTDYAEKFDEQGKEQVRLLVTKAKKMAALIDDVLQYSSAGQSIQKSQPVDLNVLLAEVIAEIAPPDHIEVVAEKNLPTIVGKKTHIIQILQNLLGNAVKYIDKRQGHIKIGCVEQRDVWTFSVADNGPGIEVRYFEKIFEISQTLVPRDGVESTGIGLSIVKKLVELNNGRVWVESEVGKGSTFYFTLPRQEQEKSSKSTHPAKTDEYVGQPTEQTTCAAAL
jgi:signal transduction histidine kinase